MAHAQLIRRHSCFAFWLLASCLVYRAPLSNLIHYALAQQDIASQILLVFPISACVIYLQRREVFASVHSSTLAGLALLLGAIVVTWLAHHKGHVNLSWNIMALLLLWISGFTAFYGTDAVRHARFALCFLVFLIPVPVALVEKAIVFLQSGSAFIAAWLFAIVHVPVFREGMVFHIPTLDLEIARECSGIRSSMVLLVTALVLSHFALRSSLAKSLFVLSVIPLVILKNGLRIVTISLLTIYVNRGFLHGWLHKSGGIVFYLLAFVILASILKGLKTIDVRKNVDVLKSIPGPLPGTKSATPGAYWEPKSRN
jgi:exosortase